jgi:aminoglycoside 6'-N-acetyltransferase I
VVRQLGANDDTAPAEELLIRFFREEAFTTPESTIRQRCKQFVELDTCGLFMASAADDAAGLATVSLQFGIEFGWLGEMDDLYVMPQFRRQGIARALVGAVAQFVRMRGGTGCQITLTPHSREARNLLPFYVKMGFEQGGREILYRQL